MPTERRDFLKGMATSGVFAGLFSSPAVLKLCAEQQTRGPASEADASAKSFWENFVSAMDKPPAPIILGPETQRGGSDEQSPDQPVFYHYGPDGFQNAALLERDKLLPEDDVVVSVSTSMIKLSQEDEKTFRNLQNAQLRVDVAQKFPALNIPMFEAMAYTFVSAMQGFSGNNGKKSSQPASAKAKPPGSSAKGGTEATISGILQDISFESDATWQKMQTIPLPYGEGRWGLNVEAQKRDSIFSHLLQDIVGVSGKFAPLLGLPGVAMSALESFNRFYAMLHSRPVSIFQTVPLPVIATQKAFERVGGSARAICLHNGTYVLIPKRQCPPSELQGLKVLQGSVVPQSAKIDEVDEAAEDTLKDVTYVTFDVEVTATSIYTRARKGLA